MTTTTVDQPHARTGPLDPLGADPTETLKALKLGQMTQTLPERLALARQRKMSHAAFLELILADEVTRRESRSAMLPGPPDSIPRCGSRPGTSSTTRPTTGPCWRT